MNRYLVILGIILALLLSGCSAKQELGSADTAVHEFHVLLDQGQFDAIYDHVSPELKSTVSEEKFAALLNAVHSKLGNMVSTKRINFSVNYNTSGNSVVVLYDTQYSGGSAKELFNYRINGGNAVLLGYHVDSDALPIK